MTGPFQRILTGVASFLLVCAIAVTGYIWAGWQPMDALYMVVITIFGVGYGEVQPVTSAGLRVLTISTIIAGSAAVIYTVGGFVQMIIDGEINRALGVRRMTREIDRLENHTIVCGFGRIGRELCQHLSKSSMPFVVVDRNPDRVHEAQECEYLVLTGNAADELVLQKAGIERAVFLAAVLPDDAANLYVTITARELNDRVEILARGENPSTERKLLRCGASQVVMPTAIGAARIAQLITRPSAESLLKNSEVQSDLNEELLRIGLHLDELKLSDDSPLVARTLGDIEIRGNKGFLIVALRHADGSIEMHPALNTKLSGGDTIILVGHEDDIPRLTERYVLKRELTYRGVKITS